MPQRHDCSALLDLFYNTDIFRLNSSLVVGAIPPEREPAHEGQPKDAAPESRFKPFVAHRTGEVSAFCKKWHSRANWLLTCGCHLRQLGFAL